MSHKRTGPSRESERGAKRTRFQEPVPSEADLRRKANSEAAAEEQAFDEQVLADLEQPNRRKAVKTDGYDSDSSDDGEGVVRSRHAGANDAADEDDDMFAPSTASKDADKPTAKKKETKFLNLGDIEGQEFSGDIDRRGTDSDDAESDFEDEDARERKAKEGMGYELTSFNMKAEMEEGKFDEDGTFHRTYDPHAVHDKWMDNIDEREMRKARRLKKRMEQREKERVQEEENALKSKDELYKELVSFLAKGETVLEALRRLGKGPKSKQTSSTTRKPRKGRGEVANSLPSLSSAMDVDDSINQTPFSPPASEQTPTERVTSLASTLMSLGNMDIYEETFESLLRTVRRSGIVPADWTPRPAVPADAKYEYHWSPSFVAASGGRASSTEAYGPFGKDELLAWRDAAYFGETGDRIELRMVGTNDWGGWDVII
jgi:CD2 antigen cytoplasmic tail-binding protein 2